MLAQRGHCHMAVAKSSTSYQPMATRLYLFPGPHSTAIPYSEQERLRRKYTFKCLQRNDSVHQTGPPATGYSCCRPRLVRLIAC